MMDWSILRKYLTQALNRYHIPGLSMAIVKEGKIILNLEFGVKNTLTHEPVTPSTVFEGASLSKPIIAYAALKMCQDGILDLDKPLSAYITEPYQGNPPNLSLVTLRHVLCHTAGFPTANLKVGEPLRLAFYPGDRFVYSGNSFRYLEHVMEHLVGDIDRYIQNTVFQPLKMADSSFIWKEQYTSQAATPHDYHGKPTEKWKPKRPIASCSLHTTAMDFAKFMIEVIQKSKYNNLSQLHNMLESNIGIDKDISWGLGWGIETTPSRNAFWHSGDNGFFKCLAFGVQQEEFGLVMMTNGANGFKICRDVIEHSSGEAHPFINWEDFDSDEVNVTNPEGDLLSNWWEVYGM
ncbi:MAG: serine hydrolase domain-containing protein [Candidatus Berkiellales bacterium]